MRDLLYWTEAVVTFFFLILTLSRSLTYHHKKISRPISLLISILLFTLIYKPLEPAEGDFWLYWFSMLIFGMIYTFFFTEERMIVKFTVCMTYLSWITMGKSLLSVCFKIFSFDPEGRIEYFLFYLLFCILMLFCSLFIQDHPLHIPDIFPWKYWMCMILTPTLIAITTNFYIMCQDNDSQNNTFTALVFLHLLLASMLSYYLSYIITSTNDTLTESRIMNQKLELQLNHMERSIGMVEQIRRDKHEMKNVYFYIQSLLKSGQIDELEEFVDEKLVHRFDAYEEFRTGNEILDFLLTQKVSEAREYQIHVMTNVLLPSALSIEENDLCGLLLNLLDNAIDASKKEKDGDIHISIRQVKNYLEIEVKNKCSSDIFKTNPLLHTTKPDSRNHGFGLRIIDSIVKKYNGIKNVQMESSYFVVDVMLQNHPH